MKKNTVIRNEAPHSVKVQEGSNVAERKVKKAAAVKEPEVKPEAIVMVKASPEVTPVPVKTPKRPPNKPHAKVRLKPQAQAAATPVATSPPPSSQLAPPVTPTPLDEAVLWEQDSPVKSRLAQLRTRNALLDEQIQRLKTPFQARGKKP